MNRIAALMNKRLDAIQTPRCIRDLQRCVRNQSECRDSDDIRNIESFKCRVVGDVQKNMIAVDRGRSQSTYFREAFFLLLFFPTELSLEPFEEVFG